MKLVVDANIPMAAEAFAPFGEVRSLPGRQMTNADLRDADALIVRSVTKVNPALLDGTNVAFVGTATIGTDHLDIPYLNQRGIRWASAQGCNARSVVEYVVAAIVEFCVSRGIDWAGRTLGIIGHGNIGSRLAPVARALGMKILVNDPPLARANGSAASFVDLPTLLTTSDFISIHVPLIKEGQDRTVHLLGEQQLRQLKQRMLLINAARGEVIDNAALLRVLHERTDLTAVLDVFENEPRPLKPLVEKCYFSTPHIAGYSYEGKINGTRMMVEALAKYAGSPVRFDPVLPLPPEPVIPVSANTTDMIILEAIRRSYSIGDDSARLRSGLPLESVAWGEHFDELRKTYPKRREFANYTVTGLHDEDAAAVLKSLGFKIHMGE